MTAASLKAVIKRRSNGNKDRFVWEGAENDDENNYYDHSEKTTDKTMKKISTEENLKKKKENTDVRTKESMGEKQRENDREQEGLT